MAKLLASQVRPRDSAAPKEFDLQDDSGETSVKVVLRRLNDLEREKANESAEPYIARYVAGGWYDDRARRTVKEPEMFISLRGGALPLSESALRVACVFCAAQVVDDEEDRYEPLEFLDLCDAAEGLYSAAYQALSEVSQRPKASTDSATTSPSEPSPSG